MCFKKKIFITLLCFLPFAPIVAVQEAAQPKQEIASPNPMSLHPTWWEYFNPESEDFHLHVSDFKEKLKAFTSDVEQEHREEVDALIKKITSNINTYTLAKNETVDEAQSKVFQDNYTLQQQIELSKQLAFEKASFSSEKADKNMLESRINKLTKHYNNQLVSYRNLSENTFQKFALGLEIINTKFFLATNKEKLRILNHKIGNQQDKIYTLEDEIAFANKHINIDNLNVEEIVAELDQAKAKLESARTLALNEELSFETINPSDLGGKFRNSIKQLNEYRFSIEEFSAEISVLMQQIKLAIAEVHSTDEESNLKDKEEKLAIWTNQLQSYQDQAGEWSNKNKEEGNRFKNMVGQEEESNENLESLQADRFKIYQENTLLLNQIDNKLFSTNIVLSQLETVIKSRQSAVEQWWNSFTVSLKECCSQAISWVDTTLFTIGDVPITLRNLLKAIVALIITFLFSHFIRNLITKGITNKKKVSTGFVYSINRLLHYTILLIGIFVSLAMMGLDFDRIYLVIGALSVGIGFGLQNIVNNFICGLMILFSRNIKVGDFIELNDGKWGTVTAINVQNSIIHNWDGLDVVVSNSTLMSERYINWSRKDPYKRVHVRFTLAFNTEKEKVQEAIIEAAKKVPATVGNPQGLPEPQCWLVEIGEYGLIFELVVWTNLYKSGNHGSFVSSYCWEIETAIKANGFVIPYPARTIFVNDNSTCKQEQKKQDYALEN